MTAFDGIDPGRNLGGVSEYLEHVVTRSTEEVLEGELERVRTRPADAGTDDFKLHYPLP
jgi:hypothetical protein